MNIASVIGIYIYICIYIYIYGDDIGLLQGSTPPLSLKHQ